MEKILFVGGTFNNDLNDKGLYGKESGLVNEFYNNFKDKSFEIKCVNGGKYDELKCLLKESSNYDYVFWWANVDNTFEKIRNVKEISPKVMLISSKRNDNNKYSFQELVQRSLAAKANLTFEFSRKESGLFNIRLFDPLGSVWYDGTEIDKAVEACVKRMTFLKKMTRQQSTQNITDKELIMKWYFDQFKSPEYKSDTVIKVPDEQDFVDVVKSYAFEFQKFMPTVNTRRFIGNASLRGKTPPQVGRCGKGMPSFRGKDNVVFVSKRNVNKQFIELDNFVPVWLENNKLMYSGNDKPSVDTPVQIRLYDYLSNINYMLHSHCYIKNAPFTNRAIPCGAIEEFDEIIKIINDINKDYYAINLIGHGSIIMWNNMKQFHETIEPKLSYIKRPMPEYMKEE